MKTSLRTHLQSSIRTRDFVRLHREGIEPGWFDGRVLAVGAKLVLLAVVQDGFRPSGVVWLRLEDLSAMDLPSPRNATATRVLALRGERLTKRGTLDATSFATAIARASKRFGLVTVHSEQSDPGVCYVGEPVSIDARTVVLRTVDPDANWDDEPMRIALRTITRVDAGGEYETALGLLVEDERS